MLRTTKKELEFYNDFLSMLELIQKASIKLEDLMKNFTNIEVKISEIAELEHECDVLAHKSFERINAAFITPIDREDILIIVKKLDDILDHIEETAMRFQIYGITSVKAEAIVFVKIISNCVEHLRKMIDYMPSSKTFPQLKEAVIEINRLENQGDVIYKEELKKLFSNEKDTLEIIKWNGIYDYLEKALDSCEDVANIIEGVVMKHA